MKPGVLPGVKAPPGKCLKGVVLNHFNVLVLLSSKKMDMDVGNVLEKGLETAFNGR